MVLFVAVVLFVVLFSWVFQRRLIYLPSTDAVPSAASMLTGARDVQIMTSDRLQLGAWYMPAHRQADTFTVLVANGNASDRSLRAPLARALANQDFGVLLFDYRGYGGNPGSPSEEWLARDVRAAQPQQPSRAAVDQSHTSDRMALIDRCRDGLSRTLRVASVPSIKCSAPRGRAMDVCRGP